ncbi:MAG: hypothetical protein OJF50_006519 [Nitrospira sp.]|jgi:CrcB protein|nr:hypothetical protein [Nitrospira sp.]
MLSLAISLSLSEPASVARCAIASPSLFALGSGFPYETLKVNVVGSLVMGLMAGLFALKFDPGQSCRLS